MTEKNYLTLHTIISAVQFMQSPSIAPPISTAPQYQIASYSTVTESPCSHQLQLQFPHESVR